MNNNELNTCASVLVRNSAARKSPFYVSRHIIATYVLFLKIFIILYLMYNGVAAVCRCVCFNIDKTRLFSLNSSVISLSISGQKYLRTEKRQKCIESVPNHTFPGNLK